MSQGKRAFKADTDLLNDNGSYDEEGAQLSDDNQVANNNELIEGIEINSPLTDENSSSPSSVGPLPTKTCNGIPSLEEQREIIDKLWKQFQICKKEGDAVYIIPENWLLTFQNSSVIESSSMPPLDINSIVSDYENFILRDYSQYPYTAVPESIFKLLREWYGLSLGSKEISTRMIRDSNGELVVEYDLLGFRIHHLTSNTDGYSTRYYQDGNREPILLYASRLSSPEEIEFKCLELFSARERNLDMSDKKMRLWYIQQSPNNSTVQHDGDSFGYKISPEAFIKLPKVLLDEGILRNAVAEYNNQFIEILVEVRGGIDGEHWPSNFFKYNKPIPSTGTVGLYNLGNTCYMNSALQCLLHIPEFNEFFLSGAYVKEINSANPLGYNGHIARSFGQLVESLFGDRYTHTTAFSPKNFKATIGHYNSIFAGYAQQDSQEFLAFLLDGLHEDLNRVVDKPYLEKPELAEGSSAQDHQQIKDLADRTWDYVRKRNDSVIMDLFVGLYKSTLICPNCNNISVTFDPYNDVTLPLPVEKFLVLKVTIFPYLSPPCSLEVELPKNSLYQDLKKYVASCANMNANDLYGFEIFNHQFYNNYEANMESEYLPLSELISINDFVVFYEVRKNDDDLLLPVFNVVLEEGFATPRLFGLPFLISLTKEEQTQYGAIRNKLETAYQYFSGGFIDFPTLQSLSQPTTYDDLPILRSKYGELELKNFADELRWVNPALSPDEFFEIQVLAVNTSSNIRKNTRYGYEGSERYQSNSNVSIPTSISSFNQSNAVPMKDMLSKPLKDLYYYLEIHTASELEFQNSQPSEDLVVQEGESSDYDGSQTINEAVKHRMENKRDAPELLVEFGNAILCKWSSTKRGEVFNDESDVSWDNPATLENAPLKLARKEREASSKKEITLDDCFDIFSRAEVLSAADSWYCPKCKQHTQASKQIELWSSPDILLIHFKRFENQRSFSDKIDAVVSFPIEGLDMTKHVFHKDESRKNIYDLVAVDNHYGGLGGGHYTAYAKKDDGGWYYFDDSRVTETSPINSINGSAYLLFYRRRTDVSGCLGDKRLKELIQESRRLRWEQHQAFLEKVEAAYRESQSEEENDQMEDIPSSVTSDPSSICSRDHIATKIHQDTSNTHNAVSFTNFSDLQASEINIQNVGDREQGYNISTLEVGDAATEKSAHHSSRRKLRILDKVSSGTDSGDSLSLSSPAGLTETSSSTRKT